MSDVQQYLLEVNRNKTEAQAIAQSTAEKLERKQLKLIDLIGSLDEYINKKDDNALRSGSLAYLADVLTAVGPRVLSNQERRLLCDFLLGRIEADVEGIGASARGLIALESKGKWDATTAQKVVQTFVTHANPLKQFKLQSERHAVIQLMDLCLAKYREAIHEMQQQDVNFIPTFIMLFEGEKDPRNLMIVFSLLQVPMAEWDIRQYAQDLFDAVFNYFPITFKPPPDDPYGITAQDLKERLGQCISSTSDFAPHAFPALLDKLDSTSMNTKRDVLQALQDCIAKYEPQTINLYSITLWDSLKFEILTPQEDDLAQEALKALGLMAAKLSGPTTDGALTAYLRPVIKECNEHLEDAPTKQSQAAGRMLHAIASGSPQAADKLVKGILPTLFELYKSTESISKRRGLLEVLNDILRAFVDTLSSGDAVLTESLQTYGSAALEAFLRALTHAPKAEVSFRLISLDGLVALSRIGGVLTQEDIIRIVDTVTALILHERIPGHGNIKAASIEHLVQLARSHPDIIQSHSIPAFMVELPDVPQAGDGYSACLEAFAQISVERQIFDVVILRLRSKYNAAKHQGASKQFQKDLLKAILFAFVNGSPIREDGVLRDTYFSQFAEPLLDNLQKENLSTYDNEDLEIIGRLCNVLLREQSPHYQRSMFNRRRAWLLEHDGDNAVDKVRSLSPMLLWLYAAFRPAVVDLIDTRSQLSVNRIAIQHARKIDADALCLLRMTTLLINKCVDPQLMQSALDETGLDASTVLGSYHTDLNLALAFSVVKALLLQGKTSALTKSYIQALLETLTTVSQQQAHFYETLLAPDEILDKTNHCIISGLYKQRTSAQLVPQIVEKIKTSEATDKTNSLIALSGTLRWLPYSVLEPTLHTLVTPLLLTLDLQHVAPAVKLSALSIFESTLMHNPSNVSEHVSSLISRLLVCASPKEKDAKVRASALQCLAIMPKQLKREAVVPYRKQVVRSLMQCLDDGKRAVRLEAVRCRTNWLGLDEPDDDE